MGNLYNWEGLITKEEITRRQWLQRYYPNNLPDGMRPPMTEEEYRGGGARAQLAANATPTPAPSAPAAPRPPTGSPSTQRSRPTSAKDRQVASRTRTSRPASTTALWIRQNREEKPGSKAKTMLQGAQRCAQRAQKGQTQSRRPATARVRSSRQVSDRDLNQMLTPDRLRLMVSRAKTMEDPTQSVWDNYDIRKPKPPGARY